MYKEYTDNIVGYKLSNPDNLTKAQKILKDYLIDYEVWEEGRDMSIEGRTFAKGSAFYDVFVRNGLLNDWYEPVYEKISLSKEFMEKIGFKTTSDDGIYGEAIDIRTNGMTKINWNREGRNKTYFGEKLEPNIAVEIRKDGGTRIAFNGYIFHQGDLRDLLKMTW